jgi:hypothetical protein
LVVDASGRGSRSPSWLEALAYAKPREEQIKVNIGYKTRLYRRRQEDLHGKMGAIIAACQPANRDPVLATKFLEVANLMKAPSTLLSPAVALRVLKS